MIALDALRLGGDAHIPDRLEAIDLGGIAADGVAGAGGRRVRRGRIAGARAGMDHRPVIRHQGVAEDRRLAACRLGVAAGDIDAVVLLPLDALVGLDVDRLVAVLGGEAEPEILRSRRHGSGDEAGGQDEQGGAAAEDPHCGGFFSCGTSSRCDRPVKMITSPWSRMRKPCPLAWPKGPSPSIGSRPSAVPLAMPTCSLPAANSLPLSRSRRTGPKRTGICAWGVERAGLAL